MQVTRSYDRVRKLSKIKDCLRRILKLFCFKLTIVSGLYNLFAALAEVVSADIAPVLAKIVDRMLDSVKSSDDILPEFKDDSVADIDGNDENDDTEDIDIETSDGEDDDDYAGSC